MMNSLIGRPVYCAVSQNGALPARINASIYSIDTTFYVLFPYVIDYVFRNSDAIIAKKQQKMMNQKKEHIRRGPGLRFVSVYMRAVRTQTGTKLTGPRRSQTGLSSFPDRSHVNASKEIYVNRILVKLFNACIFVDFCPRPFRFKVFHY